MSSRKRRKYWVVGVIVVPIAAGAIIFLGYWLKWDWTGFNEHIGPSVQQYQPAKTLWDWLNLLGILAIPVVVGLGAAWYTAQQGKVSEKANTDNQREAALQAYIDKMSELLLEKHLCEPIVGDEVRRVARVRTLTVLPRLDPNRKNSVLRFLYESGLIEKDQCIVDLEGADLREVNLVFASLKDANLARTNLKKADLRFATLTEVDFTKADLGGANLTGAILSQANLSEADLSGANLEGTILNGADLRGANLIGFSHLTGTGDPLSYANLKSAQLKDANLHNAKVSTEQLNSVLLYAGATMPDGSMHP